MKGNVWQGEEDAEEQSRRTYCSDNRVYKNWDRSAMVVLLAHWGQKDWVAVLWANRKEKPFKTNNFLKNTVQDVLEVGKH